MSHRVLLHCRAWLVALGAGACLSASLPLRATVAPRTRAPLAEAMMRRMKNDAGAYRLERAWIDKTLTARHTGAGTGRTGASAAADTMRIPVFAAYFGGEVEPDSLVRWQRQLWGPNPTGSVTDYYATVSYGALTMTGDVFGWTQLDTVESYYTGAANGTDPATDRIGELIEEMLSSHDGAIDFGRYDNDGPDGIPNSGDDDGYVDLVTFIQSHEGAECDGGLNGHVRSHTWLYSAWNASGLQPYTTDDMSASGGFIQIDDYSIEPAFDCAGAPDIIDIGNFCHDFGHALGLPDLYDPSGAGEGIGHWGIMGRGNWNSPESPAHPCAWSRARLGWVVPIDVDWTDSAYFIEDINSSPSAYRMPFADDRFRRANNCVISGSWSLYCGLDSAGASARGWTSVETGGYGSNWRETVERTFVLEDAGDAPVLLAFDYAADMEAGNDSGYAVIDAGGVETVLAAWTGTVSGSEAIDITSHLSALSDGAAYKLKFRVVTDFSFADDDGFHDSDCGALVIDNIGVTGGGIAYTADFETYADGWHQDPAENPDTEYWLVENRQAGGFDTQLAATGLFVWHVDEAVLAAAGQGNDGGSSGAMTRGIVLEEADGLFNLNTAPTNPGHAGDPFPGSTSNTAFDSSTTPGSASNSGSPTTIAVTGIGATGSPMTANLRAGARAPQVSGVTPSTIDNDETSVDLSIDGDYIQSGATFRFVHTGGGVAPVTDALDIAAASVRWVDPVRLDGTIAPYSKEGGKWDLIVTNPDGQVVTLDDALTVNVIVATQLIAARVEVLAGAVRWTWELRGREAGEELRVYRSARSGMMTMIEDDLQSDGDETYIFTDGAVETGRRYEYLLESRLSDGSVRVVHRGSVSLPAREAGLDQNFPNPFNPRTTIGYYLSERTTVRLTVYGVQGARVATLISGTQNAGAHRVEWNGTNDAGAEVSSGIYYYRLRAGGRVFVRKMVLLK